MKQVQAYRCGSCQKLYTSEAEVIECETMHKGVLESHERWRKDADLYRHEALEVARTSKAMRVLVVANEMDAARWVADKLYRKEIGWDANSSWWTEATLDEMVDAALAVKEPAA